MLTTDLRCEGPILHVKSPTFQWQIFDKNTAQLLSNFKATWKFHSYLFVRFSHSDIFSHFRSQWTFFKCSLMLSLIERLLENFFSLKSFATYVGHSIAKSAKSVKFWNNLMDKPSKILPSLVDFSIFQVQGDSICVFREEFIDQKVFPVN